MFMKQTAANVNALASIFQLFIDADTTRLATLEKRKSFEKTAKQTAAAYR